MTAEAATCVLVRDAQPSSQGFEVLLLERSAAVASFPGAWVFPGGRVDAADRSAADADDPFSAPRMAAVREVREETGMPLAAVDLVPFSRWMPPAGIRFKAFLTWFFVAPAPDTPVVVDGGEIVSHAWLTPGAALARHADGALELFPPTWVTLHQLAECRTKADAVAGTRGGPLPLFETRLVQAADGPVNLWPGDVAYDVPDRLDDDGPRNRLYFGSLPWAYEYDARPRV